MDPTSFLGPLAGGMLIGLSASILLLGQSRIAGISGIVSSVVAGTRPEAWRVTFLAGMLGTGAILATLWPAAFASGLERSPGAVLLAGLLVGVGTRLGSGCTSGHGVCGLSRRSPRSLAAVVTFMAAGMACVAVVRSLFGGVL